MAITVLDNAAVAGRLLGDPAVLAAFPELRRYVPRSPAGRCSPCAKRRLAQAAAANLNALKSFLAHLPAGRREELKRLLGADKIRVVYRVGASNVTATF